MATEVVAKRKYNTQSKLVEYTVLDSDGHESVNHADPLSNMSIQDQINGVLTELSDAEARRATALQQAGLE